MSYSLNVASLAHYRISALKDVIKYSTTFFASKISPPYFPPLKPRCVLWAEKYGTWLPQNQPGNLKQKSFVMNKLTPAKRESSSERVLARSHPSTGPVSTVPTASSPHPYP